MRKKKDTEKKAQPSFLAELLLNRTATITAGTCEELSEMIDQIPSDCSYGAGAVGRDREKGLWSLRLDLH